jgi:hypothetical protein
LDRVLKGVEKDNMADRTRVFDLIEPLEAAGVSLYER